jgi:hypothetical protein
MKKNLIFLIIAFCSISFANAQVVVNDKGTKVVLDSSKWKLTGNDIISKNTGNIGIGVNTPSAKLHTQGSLRFEGLNNTTSNTSLLTLDANGNVSQRLLSTLPTNIDSTTANNGLNLFGKAVRLGGPLTQPTTISTGSVNTLALSGLQSSTINTELLTVNAAGVISRRSLSNLPTNIDSTTSSNGINLVGKDVRLGGALTQPTTVTTTATNTLALAGLQASTTNTELLTVNAAGVISRRSLGNLPTNIDSTTASNGVNLVGKDVRLGGALTQPTTVTTTATNTFTLAGLQGSTTDKELLTINESGVVSWRTISSLPTNRDSTTASNGVSLTGKDVRLGGTLTQPTTLTTSATNTLTIAGLQSGSASTDSLLVQNNTGVVRRISSATLLKIDSTTASNGINLIGKDVRLGGALTQPTTIATTAINTLAIAGLQNGSSTDSLLVQSPGGVIKRIANVVAADFPLFLVDASRTNTYTVATAYANIAFNNAALNVGTAYNTTTGIFTAPATGLYQLYINCNYTWGNVNARAVVRINTGATINQEISIANAAANASTVLNLAAGTQVSISIGEVNGSVVPKINTGAHSLKIVRLK